MDKRIKYDLNNSVIKHGLIMMAKGVGGISRSKHTLHYYQHHGYQDMVYSSVYFLFKRALKYNPKLVQLNQQYHHNRKLEVQNRRLKRAKAKEREHKEKIYHHNLLIHEVKEAKEKARHYHDLDKTNHQLLNIISNLKSKLITAKSTTKKAIQLRTRVTAQNKIINQLSWVSNLRKVGTGINKNSQAFSLFAIVQPGQLEPIYALLYDNNQILMKNTH